MASKSLVALLTLGVLAVATPASAAQLDAPDAARSRGPLRRVDKDCRWHAKRLDGEIVGRFAICRWEYRFRASEETNPNRNFGAWWIQASVDAENGWCTKLTRAETNLPDGWKGVRPKLGTDRRGPQTYTTRLVVDAQGATANPGRITNDFIVRRGKMTAFRPNPGDYRLKWEGRPTGKKLAYAYGIEMSYPQGEGPRVAMPSIEADFRRPC